MEMRRGNRWIPGFILSGIHPGGMNPDGIHPDGIQGGEKRLRWEMWGSSVRVKPGMGKMRLWKEGDEGKHSSGVFPLLESLARVGASKK